MLELLLLKNDNLERRGLVFTRYYVTQFSKANLSVLRPTLGEAEGVSSMNGSDRSSPYGPSGCLEGRPFLKPFFDAPGLDLPLVGLLLSCFFFLKIKFILLTTQFNKVFNKEFFLRVNYYVYNACPDERMGKRLLKL